MSNFAPKNKNETDMAQIDEFFFDTNRVEGITEAIAFATNYGLL